MGEQYYLATQNGQNEWCVHTHDNGHPVIFTEEEIDEKIEEFKFKTFRNFYAFTEDDIVKSNVVVYQIGECGGDWDYVDETDEDIREDEVLFEAIRWSTDWFVWYQPLD